MKLSLSGGVLYLAVVNPWITPALAGGNDINMSQFPPSAELFADLIREVGAAMSYQAVTPGAPLGLLGIDVGVNVTGNKMPNRQNAWRQATAATGQDTIYNRTLHMHKGLASGFDLGAYFSSVADSNMKSLGGEIKYAILRDSDLYPSLAVRGSYNSLHGVDDLDLNTAGVELSVSKAFLTLIPYAGLGAVRYEGEGVGIDDYRFEADSDTLAKYFLGFNFNAGAMSIAAEADKTGENSSYSAKFGVRW